jgi:hypothetical protein
MQRKSGIRVLKSSEVPYDFVLKWECILHDKSMLAILLGSEICQKDEWVTEKCLRISCNYRLLRSFNLVQVLGRIYIYKFDLGLILHIARHPF